LTAIAYPIRVCIYYYDSKETWHFRNFKNTPNQLIDNKQRDWVYRINDSLPDSTIFTSLQPFDVQTGRFRFLISVKFSDN